MSAAGRALVAVSFATLAACGATGHQAMSGSVIMKVSDTEAHVCLFERQAPVGSQVQLYRHTCEPRGRGYYCSKQPVVVGTISQKIGEHYALVTFPQGTRLEEGYTVEPIP